MKVGVPKEVRRGERRVAATPETVARLIKLGFEVVVEKDAGAGAAFRDEDYAAQGASIAPARRLPRCTAWRRAARRATLSGTVVS